VTLCGNVEGTQKHVPKAGLGFSPKLSWSFILYSFSAKGRGPVEKTVLEKPFESNDEDSLIFLKMYTTLRLLRLIGSTLTLYTI
jgi:hypothetical protein